MSSPLSTHRTRSVFIHHDQVRSSFVVTSEQVSSAIVIPTYRGQKCVCWLAGYDVELQATMSWIPRTNRAKPLPQRHSQRHRHPMRRHRTAPHHTIVVIIFLQMKHCKRNCNKIQMLPLIKQISSMQRID